MRTKGLRLKICFDPFLPDSSCIGILNNIKGALVITSHNNTYPGIGGRARERPISSLDSIRSDGVRGTLPV